MTFQKYWENKLKSNPALIVQNSMHISIESFRLELQKAYEEGSNSNDIDMQPTSTFTDIFGSGGTFDKIFGGNKYK